MTRITNTVLFVVLIATLSFGTAVRSQDWKKHHEMLGEHGGLIRYYQFDPSVLKTKIVRNLAKRPDVANSDLTWRTNQTFEIVEGPFSGSSAARMDAGYFEAPAPSFRKEFSVLLRFRKHGPGKITGNNDAANGTLFGLGTAWSDGARLIAQYPQRNLVFSMARLKEGNSRNLGGGVEVPDDRWTHVAAVWDGRTMLLYVDGFPCGAMDCETDWIAPKTGLRIGYNGAGVGSLRMDVAEVAVFNTALRPEEILQHAAHEPPFPKKHADLFREASQAAKTKQYLDAAKKLEELLELKMPNRYRWTLERFLVEMRDRSDDGPQLHRDLGRFLNRSKLPDDFVETLRRKVISMDPNVVAPVVSSRFYREILDDSSLSLDDTQRLALEKALSAMLFYEGKYPEARKTLESLNEREIALNRSRLAEIGLSAELSDLYRRYRTETDRFWKEEKTVSVNGKPGSLAPERKQPLPAHFAPKKIYFVSPDGKSGASGTKTDPFVGLQDARNAVRKELAVNKHPGGGIEIVIRGGLYPVSETIVFERQDSGTSDSPIVYRAAPDEYPVFSGGVSVQGFRVIQDASVLNRLPSEARQKVLVASMPPGIAFPPVAPRGFGKSGLYANPSVELFIEGKPQQIARWPNAVKPDQVDPHAASQNSFVRTGKVYEGKARTGEKDKPGVFEYQDPRHERWLDAPDGMLFGYWGRLWAITSCPIGRIDPSTKRIHLKTNNYYGFAENMPYYAFNLLEEIDEPGEWYLDRKNGLLYVYPPEGVDLSKASVRLTAFRENFLHLKGVSHVTFYGLNFEEGAGTGVNVQGGSNVRFVGCNFRRFGNWALGIEGRQHEVLSCDFNFLGGGGIMLGGGDIAALTPGNCLVENCHVDDFSRVDRSYAPAVSINGVGHRVAHNLFCNSPSHALRIDGMEQIVEFNEVHSVVYESDDQAGLDIYGNPFIRGMVFRYNYWHHIGSGRDVAGQAGIRLDDMISSVLIYGNVFFRTTGGHFGGVQINGGKDTVIDNNLMIDCRFAVSSSPWKESRWKENMEGGFAKKSREKGFRPESKVYREKYPDYAELNRDCNRNFITKNAAVACDAFARRGQKNVLFENVLLPWIPSLFTETKAMPGAMEDRVPEAFRRFRSRLSIPYDSPLYDYVGMNPLPVDLMGLYVDEIRTTLPCTEVTPYFVIE